MNISFLKKYVVAIVLAWVFALGLFLGWNDSMTTDEGIHVASAYLALTRHEFRFDPEHPYLFKAATALPLLTLSPRLPTDDASLWAAGYRTTSDSWRESRQWTEEWFYTSGNNARLMIFLARIPGVLCLVGICWLTYYLGCLWFNKRIGFLALLFTAFNPNLIAHGHLANTDVPVALAFLAVAWGMWNYYRRPGYSSVAILGLLLGIAEVTKFSATILVPVVALWIAYVYFQNKSSARTALLHTGLVAVIVLAIIWSAYLMPYYLWMGTAFQIKGSPTLPATLPIAHGLFERFILIRYLLPVDYVKGLMLVLGGSVYGRPAYLLGVAHHSGFWYYFPILYAFKTQLTGLLLLFLGLALVAVRLWRRTLRITPVSFLLILITVIFLVASVVNKLNIGIRHIIPLMPLASFVMASVALRIQDYTGRRLLLGAIMAGYCITPLAQFPNYIGYANLFVQPTNRAYFYFNDSNIDWGQQSRSIAEVVKNRFYGEPLYCNFPWSPYALAYYGAEQRGFNVATPPPGALIAVTATQLSQDEYSGFRTIKPIYSLGNHTFFYRSPSF